VYIILYDPTLIHANAFKPFMCDKTKVWLWHTKREKDTCQ